MILLTPGPSKTTEAVRQAAAGPDLNHRDPRYLGVIQEVKQRLLEVYPDTATWDPFLVGGSGTAAVEAMVTSCVVKGPVLIVANGYYSDRLVDFCAIHNIEHEVLRHDWLQGWDLDRIETALKTRSFEAVLAVHDETTTGRLNDTAGLGRLTRQYGAHLLVDAMSSFGADAIDFTDIDAIAASSNKCLHALPGVGFVLTKPEMRAVLDKAPRRSYYLHLPIYRGDQPPLTPPVPTLLAFLEALREGGENLAERRGKVYWQRADLLREGMAELGLPALIERELATSTMTSFPLPAGWTYEDWFHAHYEHGYVIYACKGELRQRYFQAANMGEIELSELKAWLELVRNLVEKPLSK